MKKIDSEYLMIIEVCASTLAGAIAAPALKKLDSMSAKKEYTKKTNM